ncbi:MAG TPA: hypothetical protein VG269_14370 [Tepidisphaeraceae bacterium]|jgi:hypothetical protein|nr:hypothetical protein [Tepidisphaeraceae bacterium]
MLAKDLIVLTACKNAQFAVKGILSRGASLGIRQIEVEFIVHPQKDPGCVKSAHDLLRAQSKRFDYALVVFDLEGCGVYDKTPDELAEEVRGALQNSGWANRAEVVVISPELEIWVWSDSPEVQNVLGWAGRIPTLRQWLVDMGFLGTLEQQKPSRPKEAVEASLMEAAISRSSALYLELAEKVSLKRCTDPAFVKLKRTLENWFKAPPAA